ncbi:MAG: NAD-dependent epimerase/dehydratase family protein [Thermoleophilaceae bacterium]
MPSKVFISGALGFIGSVLADRYRADGAEVRGVDMRADPSLGVVAGDIAEAGGWQRHADGCDLVVHTAANVGFGGELDAVWRANVLGTRRVLDAAARAGAQRFVHFSSVTAFGFDFPDGVDETWPVRLTGSPYPDSKIASEQVVLQAHVAGEVQATIIRPGDVYGPRSRGWTLLPAKMIKSGQMLLPAGGHGHIGPVYVDNLVDGVVLAAASDKAAGEIFTIADGTTVEIGDFFAHYSRMLGKPRPRTLPAPLARGIAAVGGRAQKLAGQDTEMSRASVDYLAKRGGYSIEKARRVLGYEPKVSLEEGMRRCEEWLRSEGVL